MIKVPLKEIKWLKKGSKIKFYLLENINREVDPSHVTKLAKSIDKMGLTRPIMVARIKFIDGTSRLYIIDGQHSYKVCSRNHAEIPYIIVNIKDSKDLIEKIALLNASSKSWCISDYVRAWSFIVDDYKKLSDYHIIYDIEIGSVASVLSGSNVGSAGGNTITRRIKSGEFRIVDEAENVKILDKITDMLRILPRMDRTTNKYAVNEYISFLKNCNNYNHNKFIVNLKLFKDDFVLAIQEEGKLKEMFSKLLK